MRLLLSVLLIFFSTNVYAQPQKINNEGISKNECNIPKDTPNSEVISNPTREDILLAANLIEIWFFFFISGAKDINETDCVVGKIDKLNKYDDYILYYNSQSGYKYKNINGSEYSLVKIFTMEVKDNKEHSNAYLVLFHNGKEILYKIYKNMPSEKQATNDIRDLLKKRLKPFVVIMLEDGKLILQLQ